MTIEVMFSVMVCLMFILLVFIARLFFKLDEMKTALTMMEKRLMKIQDEVEYIDSTLALVNDTVNYIRVNVDELFEEEDDEDCEWTPDDEEEDDEEPEPGEVKTLGEVELELGIEVDELPIHLITPNQYMFEAGFDKFELEYSETSDILVYYYGTDEDSWENIVIDNVTECVGDALKFFGVNAKDDRHVYVRNNIFHADFRIVKVN